MAAFRWRIMLVVLHIVFLLALLGARQGVEGARLLAGAGRKTPPSRSPPVEAPPSWDADQAQTYCAGLEDLTAQVKIDLLPWAESGISRATMSASIDKFSVRGGNKGIALAFVNGTAYVVDGRLKGPIGHHAAAFFAYMQVKHCMEAGCACMSAGGAAAVLPHAHTTWHYIVPLHVGGQYPARFGPCASRTLISTHLSPTNEHGHCYTPILPLGS